MKPAESMAHHVLHAFQPIFDLDPSQIGEIGKSIPIPTFLENELEELADNALAMFKKSPVVLHLATPLYIVGDIHGNIFDLLRIIILARPPPTSRYLFLGDYVDRGQYSVEVVTLLFALSLVFPKDITILRGNHEFDAINYIYGFHAEVQLQFHNDSIFNHFNDAFAWMPLVATINDQFFCVHGGICPELDSLQQIEKIRRPLNNFDTEFVSNLLWSDPSSDGKSTTKSGRGVGVTFGIKALETFLEKFGMKAIFRAHQCVPAGIATFGDNKLYTVFSCSNYDEGIANACGLVFIGADMTIQLFSLPPITVLERLKATLKVFPFVPLTKLPTTKSSLALFSRPPGVIFGVGKRTSVTQLTHRPIFREALPSLKASEDF